MSDKRYQALRSHIESGNIKSFAEIFEIIPPSVFVRDSGIGYTRLKNKIDNPDKFSVKDIIIIADLIGINSRKLYDLIARAIEEKSHRKKR